MSAFIPQAAIERVIGALLHLEERYEPYLQQIRMTQSLLDNMPHSQQQEMVQYITTRLCDPQAEPDAYRRAAFGRILGLLDEDHRPGIGLGADGLPNIDWVTVPEGVFLYQQGEMLDLPTFYISRYHITYRQFQVFLDAEDGFQDARWWDGLAERKERYAIQEEKPQQVFCFWNHPFDGACWYDAIAFCRWWSHRLGGNYDIDRVMDWKVRLLTEHEWEKAARGTDGRHYPWGNTCLSGYANFDETDRFNLHQQPGQQHSGRVGPHFYGAPTAPGIFPQGASPYGVMDMMGTMWDLTLTEYRYGKNHDLRDYYPRVIRGGTWFVDESYCRLDVRTLLYANARTNGDPRRNDYGFRVATSVPPIGVTRQR